MNDAQKPAGNTPNASLPPVTVTASPYNGHDTLGPSESAIMAGWIRDDLAAGKITQEKAAKAFEELGTPEDQRGLSPDHRSAEQVQLDQHFTAAKPEEYVIHYEKPGQERPMDAAQKQNLKQFDQTARSWLSQAGFPREQGNSLVNAISRVTETTHGMTEGQLQSYGETEYTKLEAAYGKDLEAKLRSAARMIHELEANQPGLKQLLKSRGIGDSAMVVSMLIQQAERWEVRNRH